MSVVAGGLIGFPVGLVVGFGALTQANKYEQHAANSAGDIAPLMRSCFVGAISGTICGAIGGPISNSRLNDFGLIGGICGGISGGVIGFIYALNSIV